MCDFHSVVCYVDGAIYHAASNSHTAAVKLSWRPENDGTRRFVEAEWDGRGEFPGAEKITRGEPNEKQLRAIDSHYRGLSRVMKTGQFRGKWADPEYADVRAEFAALCPPDRLPEHADRLLSDSEWSIRREFASRCPAERLPEFGERLLGNADWSVRHAFAARCPAERLVELEDRLLSDSDWSVRYQFTLRCPESRFPEFAERLLADSNFFVRAACAKRLQAAAV